MGIPRRGAAGLTGVPPLRNSLHNPVVLGGGGSGWAGDAQQECNGDGHPLGRADGCGDTDPLQGGPRCAQRVPGTRAGAWRAAGRLPTELSQMPPPAAAHSPAGTHLSAGSRAAGGGGAGLPLLSHSPHRDHPLLRPIPKSTSNHSLTGTRRAAAQGCAQEDTQSTGGHDSQGSTVTALEELA